MYHEWLVEALRYFAIFEKKICETASVKRSVKTAYFYQWQESLLSQNRPFLPLGPVKYGPFFYHEL